MCASLGCTIYYFDAAATTLVDCINNFRARMMPRHARRVLDDSQVLLVLRIDRLGEGLLCFCMDQVKGFCVRGVRTGGSPILLRIRSRAPSWSDCVLSVDGGPFFSENVARSAQKKLSNAVWFSAYLENF